MSYTSKFKNDIRELFKKHDIHIEINDEYDGLDDYIGKSMEISSNEWINNSQPICIDGVEELHDIINSKTDAGELNIFTDGIDGEIIMVGCNEFTLRKSNN